MSEITTDPANDPEIATSVTEGERHRLLASERRRSTLDVLAERATPIALDDLAAEIAAREEGVHTDDAGATERVKITLHHIHLPKMDDLGVLDYDRESRQIEP